MLLKVDGVKTSRSSLDSDLEPYPYSDSFQGQKRLYGAKMELWFDLVTIALASQQVIEIWNKGTIFAELRAEIEIKEGFFPELLQCPFCQGPWVAGILVLISFVIPILGQPLVLALAASRLAQVSYDLLKK